MFCFSVGTCTPIYVLVPMHSTTSTCPQVGDKCYPQFPGKTKEMMSRGPQVADMEYQNTTWPAMSTCTDKYPPHHHNSRFITTVSTTLAWSQRHWVLLCEVQARYYGECHFNIWGIWVCFFYYCFWLCDICLDIMLFSLFHLRGWHCALVSGLPLGIGMLLGGPFDEWSCHS